MIKVHFTTEPFELTFANADAAEVNSNGYLRIYWRGTDTQDVQIGAVAPGWRYYEVDNPPIPTPEPDPEPSPEQPT